MKLPSPCQRGTTGFAPPARLQSSRVFRHISIPAPLREEGLCPSYPHLERLDEIAAGFGLHGLDATARRALVRLWRRSRPWPDAVPGLTRLKRWYVLSTLSNGDVDMLVEMVRRGGLPWGTVLCAEIFRTCKPDPKVYLGAAEFLADTPQSR